MRLRSRRRDLVIWSVWPKTADSCGDQRLSRPVRTRRVRRSLRIVGLLTLLGAMGLARGARYRARPLLGAAVLVVAGLMLRGGWGVLTMAGLWFLVYALLIPADSPADRQRHSELADELAAYSTAAQRSDFVATLDRYPDEQTHELRDILTEQAMAACSTGIPGTGRS
jgi:hypothetical protein